MKSARYWPCADCGQPGKEGESGRALYDVRRQLCKPCYVRRHGMGTLPPKPTIADLFIRWRVISEGGCWLWQGSIGTEGYGSFGGLYVHRLSYEHHVGPIASGLHIDHLCRNHACFNPAHLEPVTPAINIRRGTSPGAFVYQMNRCMAGHELTPDNTYVRIDGLGRQCRTCKRLRQRRYAAAARKGER